MSQTIKTRIQHKHDIEANWIKATNFVPLAGELIIYDAETQETFDIACATLNDEQKARLNRTEPITKQRFKFGDGTTNVNELPFASDEEQIQANWLQTDETKADYIKNKPIYEISCLNETLIDNVTVDSFAQDGENSWYVSAENPFAITITNNHKYKVIFDGAQYECWGEAFDRVIPDPAKDETVPGPDTTFYGWLALGNALTLGSDYSKNDNTLPFCIAVDYYKNSGEVQVFVFDSTETTHTISIIDITPTTQPLPFEYMNQDFIVGQKGSGAESVVLGRRSIASGGMSVAEGVGSTASGSGSHAEGGGTAASGQYSHSEGYITLSSGKYSHSEGRYTEATADQAHSEGYKTIASGPVSHAEGQATQATAAMSHAEGNFAIAKHKASHAEGSNTVTGAESQHVSGKFNVETADAAVVVGNGTDEDHRANAYKLDWNGNGWFSGNVSVEGTPTDDKHLVTKNYVDTAVFSCLKYGGDFRYHDEQLGGWQLDPSRVLISEVADKSLLSYDYITANLGTDETLAPKIFLQGHINLYGPEGEYEGTEDSEVFEKTLPDNYYFTITEVTNYWDESDIDAEFAGYNLRAGDTIYTHFRSWKHDTHTNIDVSALESKINTKLDKAPNGDDNLITSDNKKINTAYLPEELTKETPLIYGGSMWYYGTDQFEFEPTEESAQAGGFDGYDLSGGMVYADFSVELNYYGGGDPIHFDDAIKEGFYFEISGGDSFGGIEVPYDESIYIKRVGDHWEETKTTVTEINVVNTINGQNGDVVLTAQNINVSSNSAETIKEALTNIDKSLDAALKFGGTIAWYYDTPDFNNEYGVWSLAPTPALRAQLNLDTQYQWEQFLIDTTSSSPRIVCKGFIYEWSEEDQQHYPIQESDITYVNIPQNYSFTTTYVEDRETYDIPSIGGFDPNVNDKLISRDGYWELQLFVTVDKIKDIVSEETENKFVTSVNNASGDVVLTAEDITVTHDSDETIKDSLDSSLKFGGNLGYHGDESDSFGYWHVSLDDGTYNISEDNPPMWYNRDNYDGEDPVQIPEGTFFAFTYGYEFDVDSNEIKITSSKFNNFDITIGDYIVVKNGVWQKIDNTELLSTKINKEPDGKNALIINENKINLPYLPEELMVNADCKFGGTLEIPDYIGDYTRASFTPSDLFVQETGIPSPEDESIASWGGYVMDGDCNVLVPENYEEHNYVNIVPEGFYFDLSSSSEQGLYFGNIYVPENSQLKIERFNNSWVTYPRQVVSVVNKINSQSGDVTLTANNIKISSDSDETIKSQLDKIKTPNGTDNLITDENVISLDYMPKEMVSSLVFGGYMDVYMEDGADFSPSEEFVEGSGILSPDSEEISNLGGYRVYSNFDIEPWGGEYYYTDIIKSEFYFALRASYGDTFGGISAPADSDIYVKRVGDHWEEVTEEEIGAKYISLVSSVNGQHGEVLLTGDSIKYRIGNDGTLNNKIDSKLDKAPNGSINLLDENNKINTDYLSDVILGQLKFGGTLKYAPIVEYYDDYGEQWSEIKEEPRWRIYYSDIFESLVGADNLGADWEGGLQTPIINENPPKFDTGYLVSEIPEGFYFIIGQCVDVDSDGNLVDLDTKELVGTEYSVGDWALVSNSTWQKVDNTDAVRTVNGKIGNVVLTGEDIAISTDDTITVKDYIDSKEDKDTTYTLFGSSDPGLIYFKDNLTNYTKEVDVRRATVVGERYGVSATGYYKFLSGKLNNHHDANYLLFVNSTISGSRGGLIHVHIRRDNGSFRAPVLGWLSKTSSMEENCIGVVQDEDTGDYALYLYRSGTYTYTFVEVLSASSSIGRMNISYTLYNTQEPEDIEMDYTSNNIGVVETAIKDSAGNDIVSTYYNSKTSRTANTFLAAPDGSNGTATFRKISGKDLPKYIHRTQGDATNITTPGYAKIATFTITHTYQSALITMDIIRRNTQYPCSLAICFRSIDSTDPDIKYFIYSGEDYGAFLHKTAAGIWDLYIKKTERYDYITVSNYSTPADYIDVTWASASGCEEKLEGAIEPTYYNNINDYYTNAPITYSSTLSDNVGKYVKLLEVDAEYTVRSSGIYAIQDRETNFAGIFYFNFIGDSATYYNAGVKWLDVTSDPSYISEDMPLIATAEPYEGGTKFRIYFQPFKNYLSLALTPLTFYTSDISKFKYITPKSGYRVISEYISDAYEGELKSRSNKPYSILYDAAGQKITETYIKDIAVEGTTLTYTKGNGTTESVELPTGGGESELANKVTELEAKVAQLEAIINNITTLNVSNTSGQLNINE